MEARYEGAAAARLGRAPFRHEMAAGWAEQFAGVNPTDSASAVCRRAPAGGMTTATYLRSGRMLREDLCWTKL